MARFQRLASRATWALPFFAFTDYVGTVERVSDESMAPTLGRKDESTWVWVDKFWCVRKWMAHDSGGGAFLDRSLRGQVVYAKSPLVRDEYMMKRVVGLPGDWVSVPSSSSGTGDGDRSGRVHVGQGQLWVESDDAGSSGSSSPRDDETFVAGLIPFGLVHGRVTTVVWPPDRLETVEEKIDWSRSFPSGRLTGGEGRRRA